MTTSLAGPGSRALKHASLRCVVAALTVVIAVVPSGSLQAQEWDPPEPLPTAREVLEKLWEAQNELREDVNEYSTYVRTAFIINAVEQDDANNLGLYREKVWCQTPSGEVEVLWRTVPNEQVEARIQAGNMPSGGTLRVAARATELAGAGFNEALEREGVPVAFLSMLNPEPMVGEDQSQGGRPRIRYFNMLNPGSYFAAYGVFFDAMADAVDAARSAEEQAKDWCRDQLAGREALADNMTNVGVTQVDDRPAWQLEANVDYTIQLSVAPGSDALAGTLAFNESVRFTREGRGPSQPTADPVYVTMGAPATRAVDDLEFTVKKFTLKIDAEHYVPLLTRIEGIATQEGESRLVTFEKEETDYRQVPGSDMYESYRQILRIFGFTNLGPEMEEAQREMARMEEELAQLSPEQRAMVERTMGDKIRTMRNMAAGGPIVVETKIDEIIVNPGVPGAFSSAANPIVLDECVPGSESEECPAEDAETEQESDSEGS